MHKLKTYLSMTVMLIILPGLNGQEILMTIGDKEITLEEFERTYNKNNSNLTENEQSPEEYLDLFINFKLKVLEAESLGMDTTEKFLSEFNTYRDQLSEPYLTDEESKQEMIREAYERMKYDIHVSHILITLNPQASPEDTLKRYEKAMEIRQRIIDGEDFAAVARSTSDDPSAKVNGGDLGFFTVFMMIYPFETTAYNLQDGEISMPFRTIHGYHIIKKHETRPAIGQVNIAHIFVRTPEGMSKENLEEAEAKIKAISDSLKNGSSFSEMARNYSDDANSANNGGVLPWFGIGRMIKEFENVAFSLETPGEVSEPFQTNYGWHIIKLIDKKKVGSFEEMLPTLEANVLQGDRDRVKRRKYLDKLKEKYDYYLFEGTYKSLYNLVDSSIFIGNWDPNRNTIGINDILFTTNHGNVTLHQFLDHLNKLQGNTSPVPIENYVDINFNQYLEDFFIKIEKESLPERFPEYKYILKEYHDGILLFDLMDEKVWTRAIKDTTGLRAFFQLHRSDYMWGERLKAILVSCDSDVNVNRVYKKANNIASGKWDSSILNKRFGKDSLESITLTTLLVEKGENLKVDAMNGKTGIGEIYQEGNKNKFVIVTDIIAPQEKDIEEVKGQVTSDYQDFLENEWIRELRSKYKVNINMELLSKIKSEN